MNLLLPSAPTGAHGPMGAGDGAHARREIPDGDFAAALAETLGQSGEDAAGDEARTEQPADAAVRLWRAARLMGAREAHARQHGQAPQPQAAESPEVLPERRLKGVRQLDDAKKAGKAQADEGIEKKPAVEDVPPAPRIEAAGAAAREVLSVLGGELAPRSDRMTAGAELGAFARMAAGPRNAELDAQRSGQAAETEIADDAEAAVLPVRVVRQEKHFQPIGLEMQRWQGAQNAAQDPSAKPDLSPPVDAKAVQQEAAPRERMAAPAARAVEMAAPVAAPVAGGGEIVPGGVGVQIADRVQQALATPVDASAPQPAGASPDPEMRQAFAPAIRTIKLQLSPAALGTVTIEVSGNGDGLRIHLAAELADTVSQVENDRGVLAARLNGAGYAVTEVSVARLAGQGMDADARDQGARQGGSQEPWAGNAGRDGAPFGGQNSGRGSGGEQAHMDSRHGGARGAAAAPVPSGTSYAGRFRSV